MQIDRNNCLIVGQSLPFDFAKIIYKAICEIPVRVAQNV